MKWVTIVMLILWYISGGFGKGVGLFMNMLWRNRGSEFWRHYPVSSLDSNYACINEYLMYFNYRINLLTRARDIRTEIDRFSTGGKKDGLWLLLQRI